MCKWNTCCAMYFAVVHSVCQLWIVFAVVLYIPLPSYSITTLDTPNLFTISYYEWVLLALPWKSIHEKVQTYLSRRAKENCHCAFFYSCTICFAVVPCILQLCFLFSRCAKTMYYSYVRFRWCENEIAVVLCILQLYIQFVSCELFSQFYNIFPCLLGQSHKNLWNALTVEYGTISTYEPNLVHVLYGQKNKILCRASICFPLTGNYS